MNHEVPTGRMFQKEGPQLYNSEAAHPWCIWGNLGRRRKVGGERRQWKAWTFSDLAVTGRGVTWALKGPSWCLLWLMSPHNIQYSSPFQPWWTFPAQDSFPEGKRHIGVKTLAIVWRPLGSQVNFMLPLSFNEALKANFYRHVSHVFEAYLRYFEFLLTV